MIQCGVAELEQLGAQAGGLGPALGVDLAVAYMALGDVLGYVRTPNLGEFDRAEAYVQAGALLAETRAALKGSEAFEAVLIQQRLAERLANLARARGDFDAAAERYLAVEAALEALAPSAPTDRDFERLQIDQAQSTYLHAGLLGRAEDHAGARDVARGAIVLRRSVSEREPEGYDLVPARFSTRQSWNFVGVTSSRLGDDEGAIQAFATGRAILDELLAQRPDDLILRASKAGGIVQEMDALRPAGKLERAAALLGEGRELYAALRKVDPTDVRSRSSEGFLDALGGDVHVSRANRARSSGDVQAAVNCEREACAAVDRAIDLFEALEAEGTWSGTGAGELQRVLVRREGNGA